MVSAPSRISKTFETGEKVVILLIVAYSDVCTLHIPDSHVRPIVEVDDTGIQG
jgi:hypothetical protein